MNAYPYKKVHAFTNGSSIGNPAAYITLGSDSLSDVEMQKIAKGDKRFITTIYDMILNDSKLLENEQFEIDTNQKGSVVVYNQIKKEDAVYKSAPKPIWLPFQI